MRSPRTYPFSSLKCKYEEACRQTRQFRLIGVCNNMLNDLIFALCERATSTADQLLSQQQWTVGYCLLMGWLPRYSTNSWNYVVEQSSVLVRECVCKQETEELPQNIGTSYRKRFYHKEMKNCLSCRAKNSPKAKDTLLVLRVKHLQEAVAIAEKARRPQLYFLSLKLSPSFGAKDIVATWCQGGLITILHNQSMSTIYIGIRTNNLKQIFE